MKKLLVEGGNKLNGTVRISGAKNSAVALLPAAILSDSHITINDLPNISDVHILGDLLADIGGVVSQNENTIKINPKKMGYAPLLNENAKQLRASYYFMGAMLGKFKEAYVGQPGGCHLGPRPIDQHLKGFKALGAEVTTTFDGIHLKADELRGAEIFLDVASVGATINIMLAAVKAKGLTVIKNAAREPEIVDIATFLMKMGANIKGVGTDTIRIEGVEELHGCKHTVIPDRIEAGTYIIISTAIGENVVVDNIIPEHLEPLIAKLKEMGANIEIKSNQAVITSSHQLKSVDVKTLVHPGFPTDLQQPFTTLLNIASGTGTVTDTIYFERFKQIDQILKMGANAKVKDNTVTISGPTKLQATQVQASDLRAGAALVIAGLIADGVTEINGVSHIERGYEDLIGKLTGLGAKVWYETQYEQQAKRTTNFSKPLLCTVALANSNL